MAGQYMYLLAMSVSIAGHLTPHGLVVRIRRSFTDENEKETHFVYFCGFVSRYLFSFCLVLV